MILLSLVTRSGYSAESSVRCVLFYRPSCGPCHAVIKQTLPAILDEYGSQVQIGIVDIATPPGRKLFDAAATELKLPETRRRVPLFVVANVALMGIHEIEENAARVVQQIAGQGGADWPIRLLDLSAVHVVTLEDIESLQSLEARTVAEEFQRHLVGNLVALGILLALLLSWFWGTWRLIVASRRASLQAPSGHARSRTVLIALCAGIGLGISAYLTYQERRGDDPFCHLWGSCLQVWDSELSRVFGIPVAWIGVAGYGGLFVISLVALCRPRFAAPAAVLTFVLANGGMLMSIFLTYAQPLLLGLVCPWCLSSAVTMMIIFHVALGPGIRQIETAKAVRQSRSES